MAGRALLLTVCALLYAPSALAGPPHARSSIVGGSDAAIGDWPSIAFLLSGWDSDGNQTIDMQAQCTGTVIAPQWVISAAHCAFQPNGQPIDAMVTVTGVADLNDQSAEAIAVDRLVVHPTWHPQTLTGDALLIHLRSPSSRPALALATHAGEYVTFEDVPNAAGWGATDVNATIPTEVLQEAYLELQPDDRCADVAPGFDAATQTCAGTTDTAGACKGDSGGPLKVPFGAPAGTVKRRFLARRGSKPLKPGRYVLRLAAVDTAGNPSRLASVAFSVVR